MTGISKVLNIHLRDKFSAFLLPLIILGISFIINLIIALILDTPVFSGGVSSLYVYLFVAGIIGTAQTFTFSLGFSIRRKDYYWGTLVYHVGVGLIFAVMLILLSLIEGDWLGGWRTDLYFFHLPYLSDGGVLTQLFINFVLTQLMLSFGFAIASLFRRFGRNGLYAAFLLLIVVITVFSFLMTYYNMWSKIIDWLSKDVPSALQIAWALVPVIVVMWLMSYLWIRRATTQ